ncbi:MAG: carbohydrate-binding domain-containing protein [Prevotella sp.]|nr:carbohydrate-binding domain-containing protein [Prevotella sp.]
MKKIFIPIFAVVLIVAGVFVFCIADWFKTDSFQNPGDYLGGGGTGEVATEVDATENNAVIAAIASQTDLSTLRQATTADNATMVAATSDVVEISASGTYVFQGSYGGIAITKKNLELHFILDGVTIDNAEDAAIKSEKGTNLIITLNDGTVNTVTNSGADTNAIHIKGTLWINGGGTLQVTSHSKSAIKVSKTLQVVAATLQLNAQNHGLTAATVIADDCTINVTAAGKDGINAECDEATAFTTDEGFIALTDVAYTCNVAGDGIQAATVVYIQGGNYHIQTSGTFVQKTTTNMSTYGMDADDFKYTRSGNTYQRIASDETARYSASQLYGLTQSCKGIKVGVIEYTDADGNTVTVTMGDYLLVIMDSTVEINSTDDAIHANCGNVLIDGGTYTLDTCDDGITADNLTKIAGGTITINSCYEGMEGAYVEITGGTIQITASDDGINAASDDTQITEHILISGGTVTVDAGGDGIDSNGSILISGGTVTVFGPTNGADAGLDADRGIVITGGKVFATSALGMVETPSTNSTQYVVSYAYQSTIKAGAVISLCDSDGNALFSVTVAKNCQSIIFSIPELVKGSTYTLYGGNTKLTSFTVTSTITTIGSAGSNFPGGNNGPGGNRFGGMW